MLTTKSRPAKLEWKPAYGGIADYSAMIKFIGGLDSHNSAITQEASTVMGAAEEAGRIASARISNHLQVECIELQSLLRDPIKKSVQTHRDACDFSKNAVSELYC